MSGTDVIKDGKKVMLKKGNTAASSYKTAINVTIIVTFTALMAGLIFKFNHSEPDFKDAILKDLGEQFEANALYSHWQWEAEGRPEMIMLVQYNDEGREVDRSPVRIAQHGLPYVEPTSEGCEALWDSIMPEPRVIDGYRVHGEYYRQDLFDGKPTNSFCRYRLTRGSHFDYYIYRGVVEHESE